MFAIIRQGRIGLQLQGHIAHRSVMKLLPDQDHDRFYRKDLFVYPLQCGGPSHWSLTNDIHPYYEIRPKFERLYFLVIDADNQIRVEEWMIDEKNNNTPFYRYSDIDQTSKRGIVVSEDPGDEFLQGMLMANASEDLINQKTQEHFIGSGMPVLWYTINDIVQKITQRTEERRHTVLKTLDHPTQPFSPSLETP